MLAKPARERGLKKERLQRLLLNYADGEQTRYEIAKRTGVSTSWAYEYIDQLEKQGLVEDRTVRDP